MVSVLPSNCCSSKSFDEHRWVTHIRGILDQEPEDDSCDIRVTICSVPKALRDTNPNAYTPQLVALGPYHYWRPELQEMEKYKISSAKRIQNQNPSVKFRTIVDRFIMLEHRLRACYHKHLDINGETLAWMMAIDSGFLLEIISMYAIKEERKMSRMSHLVDYARRKSAHDDILRDIIMLENQIPLFVLKEMLEFWSPTSDMADRTLATILVGLCKDLSPFKLIDNWERIQPSNCQHLLNFVYSILVPILDDTVDINEPIEQQVSEERKGCNLFVKLEQCFGHIPLRTMFKVPWIFITNLPGFAIIRALLFSEENHLANRDNGNSSHPNQDNKPPTVEEIMIPSVDELSKVGVTFVPTDGDIMSISFDRKNKTFYLPTISFDVNTEVLLRNLVAYEASSAQGSLVISRYTELMNGIIDTEEDVRLLRERGIIFNYLKSDKEVANVWNGMSKSLRLTRVPFLDEVIENVNKYYEGNWKAIMCKLLKAYVTHSWQFLAFLAAAFILFLLILQVICNVLYCHPMVGAHARWRA